MSATRLTDEHIKDALVAHKGENAKLVSWKFGDFFQKADVYTSDVVSIKVTYEFSNQIEIASWVLKIAQEDVDNKKRIKTRKEYKRETDFYQKILPELSSILRQSGVEKLGAPMCLLTSAEEGKEFLIFEDLYDKKFRMHDGNISWNFSHVELAMKELAKFHASAYVLQYKDSGQSLLHPELFAKTTDNLTFFKETALSILKDFPKYKKAVTWLEKNGEMCTDIVFKHLMDVTPLTIFCHGSCWNNNFMFRYNENNEPAEVMLLDFQYMRKSPLVLEIHELLYSNMDGATRKTHLNSLLTTYCEYFTKILKGCGVSAIFTLEELYQEYKKRLECGFLLALNPILWIIYGGERFPEYTGPPGDKEQLESFRDDVKIQTIKILNANAHFKDRLFSIFDDMIEYGIM